MRFSSGERWEDSSGRRAEAALERDIASHAQNRRRDRCHRRGQASTTGRTGTTAADTARRRSRAGLVASSSHSRYAQADLAHSVQRDRGAQGAVTSMVLHWRGGDHTALHVKLRLNAVGRHHWPPPEDTIALRWQPGPVSARQRRPAISAWLVSRAPLSIRVIH